MVVHAYYPIGESRVQREAKALVDNNCKVDVICLRQPGEPSRAVVYGVNVYRMPVRRHKGCGVWIQLVEYLAFFCLSFWRLTTLHLQQRYSAVQLHNPPDFLVFAALAPRLMGVKVILDLHDLTPEFYASRFKSDMDAWPVRLVRWQEYLACLFANHVITVSEPWRQTLIQRGLAPDKCSVVMNVADSKLFRRDQLKQHLPPDNYFHLFYHVTLTHRYGIDIALQAVARLQGDLPDIRLTIHGRGLVPYRRDVFTDGILPTKLMEYAALGIPTVVARTPSISAYFDETMVEFFTAEDVEELAHYIRTLYYDQARLNERLTIFKSLTNAITGLSTM